MIPDFAGSLTTAVVGDPEAGLDGTAVAVNRFSFHRHGLYRFSVPKKIPCVGSSLSDAEILVVQADAADNGKYRGRLPRFVVDGQGRAHPQLMRGRWTQAD
jgi:hypothetical protein